MRAAAFVAPLYVLAAAIPQGGLFRGREYRDVGLYGEYAQGLLDGRIPYRDVFVEYPPGAFAVLIPPALLPFYRDIHDHIIRVTDLAESYRDLISGCLDAYMSVVGNRMNEIMKVLTIFSAIMLPLTFIAGVYGMNFENMPELTTRFGYFVVLTIMVVVAIGMLLFFWARGWLGSGGK